MTEMYVVVVIWQYCVLTVYTFAPSDGNAEIFLSPFSEWKGAMRTCTQKRALPCCKKSKCSIENDTNLSQRVLFAPVLT